VSADMKAIREREADPAVYEHANKVAQYITDNVDPKAFRTLGKQAERATSPRAKVILLRQLADNLGKVAKPVLACKAGCSHCCHMPVIINAAEAAQIAHATGAPMSKPEFHFPPRPDMSENGNACVFLVDGACSIYANRPFACRVHFVVDRDATLCEIVPGENITAPHLDVGDYHSTYLKAFGADEVRRMANLSAFFPHGLGRKGAK